MKILHIVYGLLPGQYRGGISKIVYELARAQAALGHRVTIYTTNYNGNQHWPLTENPKKVVFGNVVIYYFEAFRQTVLFSTSMQKYLLQQAPEFDVLHTHNIFHPLNQYVRQAASACQKPMFHHTHGSLDPEMLKKGFMTRIKKWIYLKVFELPGLTDSNGIFVHSTQERDELLRWNAALPVVMIPNGIDSPLGSLSAQKPARELRITTLSRIHPKKRLHRLIEAIALIKNQFPRLQLQIIGDFNQFSNYTTHLKRLITRLQLTDRVHFLGYMPETEKYQQLATTTLFCQLSESEGMSIAVLEAMSLGIPCLVSRGCYMPQAARSMALAQCEGTDPMEISGILTSLLEQEAYRAALGQRAKHYIQCHHNWQSIATQILEIYTASSKS